MMKIGPFTPTNRTAVLQREDKIKANVKLKAKLRLRASSNVCF